MAISVPAQPGPADIAGSPDGNPPVTPPAAASSPEAPQAERRPRERALMPRSLVIVLGTAAGFLVLGGIHLTAWLVGPLFLALIIVIAMSPVQSWLRGRGWPAWLTTLVLVLLVTGLVLLFVLVIVISFARLAQLLPQYADQGDQLTKQLASSLQSFGV